MGRDTLLLLLLLVMMIMITVINRLGEHLGGHVGHGEAVAVPLPHAPRRRVVAGAMAV